MDTIKAVKDAEPDPKVGKPRATSGVSFPYWNLDSAVEVAKTMHERAGGICDNAQLATILGYSGVSNGSFRTRVSATKMFGLIENTDDGKLRVSERGRHIIAPVTPAEARGARLDAFLAVDLFRKVFDRYNGGTLPENVGLRNLLQNEYHVVEDRVAPTVRILLDSADQAGLFEAAGNRTKMVMPFSPAPSTPSPASLKTPAAEILKAPKGGGDGGDGGDESGIDPAILGLLKRLPPGGTPLTEKRRKALIDAFTATVGFIYPEAEESA